MQGDEGVDGGRVANGATRNFIKKKATPTRHRQEVFEAGHVNNRGAHQLVRRRVEAPARETLCVGPVVKQGVALLWLHAAADLCVFVPC